MPQTAFFECPISPFGMSHFTIWGIPFHHLEYIFGTFAHNIQPRFSVCLLRFFAAKYARFLCQFEKLIELLFAFCVFVILCFCILQMLNCFRSAIETSFIALTYSHFDESWSDMTKVLNWLLKNGCRNSKNLPKSSWTTLNEFSMTVYFGLLYRRYKQNRRWGCGRVSNEGAKWKNGTGKSRL